MSEDSSNNNNNDNNNENNSDEPTFPLERSWTFYHDVYLGKNQTADQYAAQLKEIFTVTTVQNFWQTFNSIPSVSKLGPTASFHMMVEGIKPLWEDPGNCNGGFWVIHIPRDVSEAVFEAFLLAIIGEQFASVLDEDDGINGLTISVRLKSNIIEIWTKNARANKEGLLNKINEILSSVNVHVETIYYKCCKEHSAYSEDYEKNKKT
eukprot:TRINITY_DN537_c2_g1_i1.p1 TRINITY_DN537_c2_g1~~TRINITY_DN537_c2_g1_i1.p1  ORF type:complete len:207 (-),score=70.43 TRINITY_DN537_c2_g1_i1:101-721(-)